MQLFWKTDDHEAAGRFLFFISPKIDEATFLFFISGKTTEVPFLFILSIKMLIYWFWHMNKIMRPLFFFIQVWKRQMRGIWNRWGRAWETFFYLALSRPMSCFFLLQSPYFASMFSGSWKESSMKKVEMDIVDENIDEDCKYSHSCVSKQIQLTLIH